MARNIRWTIPFKSVSGVDCHVDIYDDNWSGAVTTLTGSDDPFYYSEDDSEDMLEVVRIKTGYISVVENTYGELDALRPTNTSGRYVKFWYGNRLDFVGFIQYQDFDNDWVACPRVLQFPIVSPLGLTEGRTFAKTSPQYRSLGNILYEVLQSLNAGYTKVIFPNDTPELAGKINSLVICPFSNDFPQIAQTDPALLLYDPISMMDFLTYLCNAYGWMVHDQADVLVFTRLDYTGGYYSYAYNALVVPTGKAQETEGVQPVMGNTEADLEDYFTFVDDSAVMTSIQPLRRLTLKYDVDNSIEETLTFDHSTFVREERNGDNVCVFLKPATDEISGDLLNTVGTTIDSSGRLVAPGVYLTYSGYSGSYYWGEEAVTGNDFTAPVQRIIIRPSSTDAWAGRELVKFKFYLHPKFLYTTLLFQMEVAKGAEICKIKKGTILTALQIVTTYRGETRTATMTFNDSNEGFAEIPITPNVDETTEPIEISVRSTGVWFYANTCIERVGIKVIKQKLNKYLFFQTDKDVFEGNVNAVDTGDIDMHINRYRWGLGYIDVDNGIAQPYYTTYPYLFQQQRRLQAAFRLGTMPAHPYNIKFNYAGMTWRYIAAEFHPREDEYRLTLQSSPVY